MLRDLLYEFVLIGIWAALVAALVIASFIGGARLDAVTVRFTGPGAEPADATVLGLGKDHVKPDYRLDVVRAKNRFRCATVLDTSAADGIRFVVSGDVSMHLVQELALIEEDKVDDDPVTSVRFAPPSMSSGGYAFSVESSRSFRAGFDWVASTALGQAYLAFLIIATIALAIRIIAKLQLRPDDFSPDVG